MVISYYGALNAFLAIYSLLPTPVSSFILMSLFLWGGAKLLKMVAEL